MGTARRPGGLCLGLSDRGWLAIYTGDWAQAREDLERSLAAADAYDWARVFTLWYLGIVHLVQGSWELAGQLLEEATALAAQHASNQAWISAQRVLVELDLLQGRPEAARARLRPLFNQPHGEEHDYAFMLPSLALACLQLGELAEAEEASARSIAYSRRDGNRLTEVDALRVRALIAIRQERFADAASSLDEGLTLARAMCYPYAEGRLLQVYGQLDTAQGDPAASARYWEALAIFRRLGARKDAERVEQALGDPSPRA